MCGAMGSGIVWGRCGRVVVHAEDTLRPGAAPLEVHWLGLCGERGLCLLVSTGRRLWGQAAAGFSKPSSRSQSASARRAQAAGQKRPTPREQRGARRQVALWALRAAQHIAAPRSRRGAQARRPGQRIAASMSA